MSEQKMPAQMESVWDLLGRERRAAFNEGFAAGRQQEREAAARRVAEQAGEPVAWMFWHRSDPDDSLAAMTRVKENAEHLATRGYIVHPLYTTTPSADALVEALERLMRALDTPADDDAQWTDKWERIHDAQEIAQRALAKHKENSR